MIPHFYESIPGWFNFQDLYRDAVARASDGDVFVEVGSWLGRSTAFMATEIANSGKRILFYAVDTWKGSPAPQYQEVVAQHGGSVYEVFLENMFRGGLFMGQHFNTIMSTSVDAAKTFEDGTLAFVFIDGAHDFKSVSNDVQAWGPKLRCGGNMGGHDANCPGLMNAVKQWIPGHVIRYRGTSWVARREHTPQNPWLRRVGVVDYSLDEWRGLDYAHRMSLAGATEEEIATVIRNRDLPPTPPDRYIAKWGGPPGHETFEIPYNISTTDW